MSGATRHIDDVYTFYAVTTKFDTGVATDADAVPAYRVYEEETATPLLTGNMALLDSTNTAGLYSEQITLSAANGFEVGKCYAVHIAATVNSVAGATVKEFVVRKKPLTPTTEGRELDVTATGAAGIDWGNVENKTTANDLTGTNIKTDQVVASVTGAVGSVTGAVGSVTGNVGGNVTGTVGSVVGAVGSVTGNVGGNVVGSVGSLTVNNDKTGYVLSAAGSAAMTESYAADGAAPTLGQFQYMLWSLLAERTISGTTLTANKLDGTTAAMTFTLDDAVNPASQTRAT